MTKEEYLKQLRIQLRGLEERDINEIVSDQEEFIRDAMSAGRSESDVLRSLGTPKSLADSLKLEYKVKRIDASESTWESYKEILGSAGILLALAPLNFFILFGPVIAILSFMFTWILTSSIIVFTGAALLIAQFVVGFFAGFNFLQTAALLFGSIGIMSLGLIGVALFVLISKLFIKVFISYAQWNISLIKNNTEGKV
jgi:uncharacterized membrane protein